MIEYDADVMRLLLENGADPNREHDIAESLFDWAEWHYRNDEYDLELPEQPTDIDSATTDSWLAFLDCLAVKYGKPRPACLQLLRKHGAIGWRERQSASGE